MLEINKLKQILLHYLALNVIFLCVTDIKDAIIKEENEEQLDDTIPLQQQAQISYQTPQRARSNLSFKSVKGDKMLGPMPDVMR